MVTLAYPSRDKPNVYRPVGHCIYCGGNGDIGGLSREHIIPLALGGGLILPKSSCATCSAITGRVESVCLNNHLGPYRKFAGYRSNRRGKAGRNRHKSILRDGKILLTVDPSPAHLRLPEFYEPDILLSSKLRPMPLLIKRHEILLESRRSFRTASEEMVYIEQQPYDLLIFARMLAKIGHSFVCGEIGEENFDSLLEPLILGFDTTFVGSVIGQSMYLPNATTLKSGRHAIGVHFLPPGFEPSTIWVVARIRLFAAQTCLVYSVVVGKFTPTRDFLNWRGLSTLGSTGLELFQRRFGISPDPPPT